MLNDEDVPLIHENICDLDAIAFNRGRAVVPGQDPILYLILWIDVALEAAISFREAIEQDRKVHRVELELGHLPLVHVLSGATLR